MNQIYLNDLHDGNILISDNHNELFIIDLGLSKPISNLQDSDKKANEIYGIVPYMAPEILRKKPYTKASDIYSFSMIINTPKWYVDLMEKCWDSNPSNRPTITELEYKISEWIRCVSEYYRINRDGNYEFQVPNVNNNLRNDMFEFVKANNTLAEEQTNISTIAQSHSQAYYTSRNITEIVNSECLEYIIET
ncbi:hypothetical protein RclHR1_15650002 [Rhizophagus clarus]|uniref:Protein kinase domain-containing protein n=1 Tax=Rhizophagus clarus TaxID=94130 RepID=A0A2Z6QUU8_9GLOM|nr:hypothetical protein RclHR1_15650002 [Rhizophagus clarus]